VWHQKWVIDVKVGRELAEKERAMIHPHLLRYKPTVHSHYQFMLDAQIGLINLTDEYRYKLEKQVRDIYDQKITNGVSHYGFQSKLLKLVTQPIEKPNRLPRIELNTWYHEQLRQSPHTQETDITEKVFSQLREVYTQQYHTLKNLVCSQFDQNHITEREFMNFSKQLSTVAEFAIEFLSVVITHTSPPVKIVTLALGILAKQATAKGVNSTISYVLDESVKRELCQTREKLYGIFSKDPALLQSIELIFDAQNIPEHLKLQRCIDRIDQETMKIMDTIKRDQENEALKKENKAQGQKINAQGQKINALNALTKLLLSDKCIDDLGLKEKKLDDDLKRMVQNCVTSIERKYGL
jgi:hypothetical protein